MANPEFGIREFLNLILELLSFYQRHKAVIDAHLNDTNRGDMNNLLAAIPLLQEMVVAGPNPTTVVEGEGEL